MTAEKTGAHKHSDGAVTLTAEAVDLCQNAAWELETLSRWLPLAVPIGEDGDAGFLARSIASRVQILAGALMAVIGSPQVDLRVLVADVFPEGPR